MATAPDLAARLREAADEYADMNRHDTADLLRSAADAIEAAQERDGASVGQATT